MWQSSTILHAPHNHLHDGINLKQFLYSEAAPFITVYVMLITEEVS
jgi:hypothetical protein